MPRFTLTARHEGKWRWAAITADEGDNQTAIEAATAIIDTKSQSEDPVEASLWAKGGCTLADPSGHIIWTRPVQ